MDSLFIRCSDPETIDRLKSLGYVVLSQDGKFTIFLNDVDKAKRFTKDDEVVYTNILSFGG